MTIIIIVLTIVSIGLTVFLAQDKIKEKLKKRGKKVCSCCNKLKPIEDLTEGTLHPFNFCCFDCLIRLNCQEADDAISKYHLPVKKPDEILKLTLIIDKETLTNLDKAFDDFVNKYCGGDVSGSLSYSVNKLKNYISPLTRVQDWNNMYPSKSKTVNMLVNWTKKND